MAFFVNPRRTAKRALPLAEQHSFSNYQNRSVVAAGTAHDADDIQEDVDIIQVQAECADDGGFVQHGSIAAIVGVIVLQLLGVISREQHKHQDRNRAKHDIHHTKARAGQHADQAAHQAGQNNGNQSTHQVDTPAAQIALGSGTVNSHNAKVHGTNQERQNQRGKIIDDNALN